MDIKKIFKDLIPEQSTEIDFYEFNYNSGFSYFDEQLTNMDSTCKNNEETGVTYSVYAKKWKKDDSLDIDITIKEVWVNSNNVINEIMTNDITHLEDKIAEWYLNDN